MHLRPLLYQLLSFVCQMSVVRLALRYWVFGFIVCLVRPHSRGRYVKLGIPLESQARCLPHALAAASASHALCPAGGLSERLTNTFASLSPPYPPPRASLTFHDTAPGASPQLLPVPAGVCACVCVCVCACLYAVCHSSVLTLKPCPRPLSNAAAPVAPYHCSGPGAAAGLARCGSAACCCADCTRHIRTGPTAGRLTLYGAAAGAAVPVRKVSADASREHARHLFISLFCSSALHGPMGGGHLFMDN